MTKRKWYVVTVGKNIGVFPTWIEAAPLVKGVSEAIYQSFPTEEEARRLFAQEMLKGTTKVIRDDGLQSTRQPTPRSTANRSLAYPNHSTSFRHSISASSSPIFFNAEGDASRNSNRQETANVASQSDSSHTSNQSYASSRCPSVTAQLTRPLSRSASEPSASFLRAQKIEALFKKSLPVVGVQALPASPKRAQALTPTSAEHLNQNIQQQPERAIVQTPDWLTSYPQAGQPRSRPLSPLNSEDMPLNTFASLSIGPIQTGNMSHIEANSPSVGGSSIYMSPSPRQFKKQVYQYDVDPQSPIKSKAQVPELTFESSLSFCRPSPFHKGAKLSEQLDPNGTPQSSLLFKSSPSSC